MLSPTSPRYHRQLFSQAFPEAIRCESGEPWRRERVDPLWKIASALARERSSPPFGFAKAFPEKTACNPRPEVKTDVANGFHRFPGNEIRRIVSRDSRGPFRRRRRDASDPRDSVSLKIQRKNSLRSALRSKPFMISQRRALMVSFPAVSLSDFNHRLPDRPKSADSLPNARLSTGGNADRSRRSSACIRTKGEIA